MARLFTGDTHLFCDRALHAEGRPFSDHTSHIEAFIKQWNSQVNMGDTVEFVGDLSDKYDYKSIVEVLEQLNGNINFIMGNKDNYSIQAELLKDGYIKELHLLGKTINIDGLAAHITHYPLELGPRLNIINIHGHIHKRPSNYPNQFNVGVDSPILSYKPPFYLATEGDIKTLFKENKSVIESWYDNFNEHVYCSEYQKNLMKK